MNYKFIGTFVALGGLALFVFFAQTATAQTSCLRFPSGSAAPSGYGASWDVFSSAKELLVKTNCPTEGSSVTVTVGKGDSTQYIWGTAYTYSGSGWVAQTLTGDDGGNGWLTKSGTKTVTSSASSQNPMFIAGYVCTNRSGAWKCGCKDSSCTQAFWQLQAYTGIPGAGGGSSTPPPKDFPAITACGSTVSVTSSSLDDNLGNGCRTLLLSPGSYGMLRINNHSGGVLTLRCTTPGECKFSGGGTGGANITNSDGIILDGVAWTSGYLTLEDSKNIRVQNSSFRNLVSSGLVVNLGTIDKQVNIQLVNNDVYSDESRIEDTLDDGSKNYTMDYGFRIYNAKSIYIAGNTFNGGFNHAISLKEGVGYALIENNTFVNCGRNCVEPGQEPISSTNTNDCANVTSDEALITKNTFKGKALIGVLVKNIRKTTITDNDFLGSYTKIKAYTFDSGTIGSCVVSGNGIPAGRQIIDSGN